MSSELTAGPTLVGSAEDLRVLSESLNQTAHMLRKFTEPLQQVARVAQQVGPTKETAEKWPLVKSMYESAPPHETRRLGNMTIKEAYAFHARRAAASARGKSATGIGNFFGGRVQAAPRASRRRSVRAAASRGSPASRSDPDEPDLDELPGFRAASSRMYALVGRRLAVARAA
jgi:hypothetical protein